MKTVYLFAVALCFAITTHAQLATSTSASLNLGNISIDDARYDGIEKDPYLFAEFAQAKVYDKKKDKTDNYLINYNGYSKAFEFIHNGEKYELDITYYDVIDIAKCTPNPAYASKFAADEVKFVKGLDPKNKKNFQMLIYANEDMTIYKNFEAKITTRESTDNGTTIKKNRFFSPYFYYYTLSDGDKSQLRLNKKKILATLDNSKVDTFAKKNKLKLNNESDLKKVLAYYNDVTLVEKPGNNPVAAVTND